MTTYLFKTYLLTTTARALKSFAGGALTVRAINKDHTDILHELDERGLYLFHVSSPYEFLMEASKNFLRDHYKINVTVFKTVKS